MRRQKQLRRIELAGPSFQSLPGLIVGSKRVATMHRSHAAMIADTMPVTVRELPFDIPQSARRRNGIFPTTTTLRCAG